jgi:glycerophosphoryl diester phosphodiesterase
MKASILLSALICTALGCATVPRETSRPMDRIEVIAHRGASAYAPENTLAAFRLAAEQHADWFELDCHLTSDGEVVVIHDHDTERTTNAPGSIHERTMAQLKQLDAGSWKDAAFAGEPLPTLAEALEVGSGKIGVYIEIKDQGGDDGAMAEITDAVSGLTVADTAARARTMAIIEAHQGPNLKLTRKVIELVRAHRLEKEIVIQSFAPLVCTVAAIEAPELRVEVLAVDDDDDPGIWETYLRYCYLFDFDGFNTNAHSLTEGRLAALHAADRSVAIWTIDKEEDIRKYATWGVDRIITNRPDVCLTVLTELGRR